METQLDEINKSYLEDSRYQDENEYPDLAGTLERYKRLFMEHDEDSSGYIDVMELKNWMNKMRQAKTHLELKKMIAEVDRENRGMISYNDFVFMRLEKRSSVLKFILQFEERIRAST